MTNISFAKITFGQLAHTATGGKISAKSQLNQVPCDISNYRRMTRF